ncbi:MAG TPA: hypothetical protein PK537_01545 [Candidatus Limiplasma sp.]|nr:hypothetical protein [Candidatus Limiplasma sp.]
MAMSPAKPKRRGVITVKQLVMLALCTAILLAVQVAMAPLPNIELVSLLVVLYTLFFRWRTLLILYAFVLLEGLLYGFGLWWIHYLYVWTVLWGAAMLLHRMKGTAGWVLLLAGYGLCFGLLCSVAYLFIGGPKAAFSYFISGIPFDLAHCAGNAVIGAVLFHPLRRLFTRFMPAVS